MKLQSLSLKNFRAFESAKLNLSNYTIIRGPNRAGKTSLLLGLSWGLTGANSLTHQNGNNWEHLQHNGADQTGVRIELSDFGTITRLRGKKHSLAIPNADSDSPGKTQPLLYERLGVHPETLNVILDPKPFVNRDPQAQRDALTRALRPPEIHVTATMKKHGIEQIRGIEHLTKLTDELKTGKLRDLNREFKKLEEIQISRPEWPFPERTEDQIRKVYDGLVAERDKLTGEIGGLRERVQNLHSEMDAEEPEFDLLPDDEHAKLTADLKKIRATINRTEKAKTKRAKEIATKQKELEPLDESKKRLVAEGEVVGNRLKAIADPVDCPATDCPVLKEWRAPLEKERKELTAREKAISAEFAEVSQKALDLQNQIDKQDTGLRADLEKIQSKTAEAQGIQRRLDQHDAQAKAREKFLENRKTEAEVSASIEEVTADLTARETKLAEVRAAIQEGDEALKRIDEYRSAKEAGTKHGQECVRVMDERKEIQELIRSLEKLKRDIVGDKIEAFLRTMKTFLEPFNVGELTYSFDGGFQINGLPIEVESDGCALMMFEAAFRVAMAKTTGLDWVVLDHKAPLSQANEIALARQLFRSGCQVIQTFTNDQPPTAPPKGGYTVWFIDKTENGSKLREISG